MKLHVNSSDILVPGTVKSVGDLLEYLKLNQKAAIVELNAAILEKSQHAETELAEGDRIEIVHFVGGG
ncbi:sulfur carrier protein ThiS [Bacillus infantis]|uniref:sulfur carrier protein ThiS n=1 Tax=Bacillus infantis TaxID=324767 RepID=UPI002004C746|nr:sulfur carrier protein ThiS [Bacillus infantis]MCK6207993.1 sulfur carrier protein ThiS [Bacillus infantis]